MAKYIIKDMPEGMGNNKKGRIFPKMQVYSEFDNDKVVELINKYSPAFSQGTIRGVLDTLSNVMKAYLPMGHSLKINNLGVFSLSLQFSDNKADTNTQETTQAEPKTKYRHVEIKGINFKADKKLVKEMNKENSFEHTSSNPVPSSSYTPQERLQRALQHIDKNRFITLQEYANLNDLSRSSASRELVAFVNDPSSGITTKGAGSHKFWVRRK